MRATATQNTLELTPPAIENTSSLDIQKIQDEKDFIGIEIENSLEELSQASTQAEETSLSAQDPSDIEIQHPLPQDQGVLISSSIINRAKQASFLRKVCAVLISIIVWASLVSNQNDIAIKLEMLIFVASCCLMYITLENLILCLTQDLAITDHKERLFDALDGLLALYFLFVVRFQGEENTGRYLLVASPCLYLAQSTVYIIKTMASNKKTKILKRLCCTIQVSFITARILGYISSMNFMTIFMPLGLFLAGHQVYGLYALRKFFLEAYQRRTNGYSLIKGFLQMSWYSFYYGLSTIGLVILVNLCMQMDTQHIFEAGKIFSSIIKYCITFLGYTLILSNLIGKYHINIYDDSEDNIEEEIEPKKYSLVPHKKVKASSSFLRISPTYFIKQSHENNYQTQIKSSNQFEEKNLCYVCEINKPDIILMGCGHGGMCKNCVLLSMKKNNNCMECRRPVESIYQINKERENTGVVEAYEAYSIIY